MFDLKTGAAKKVRTVKSFPLPTRIIELVNAWGRRYQKEDKKDKLEFLNRQRLKYDWDNDELEYNERIVDDSGNVDFPAQFLGIELDQELGEAGTNTLLDPTTKQ